MANSIGNVELTQQRLSQNKDSGLSFLRVAITL